MIKGLLFGFIGAVFALLGFWVMDVYQKPSAPESAPSAAVEKSYTVRKAGSLNVPVLREGILHGYLVVQVAYAVDREFKDAEHNTVETLLHDEAFRLLYSDASIDWRSVEKFDLAGLKASLVKRLQSRLETDSIKDVLIREFSFVPSKKR